MDNNLLKDIKEIAKCLTKYDTLVAKVSDIDEFSLLIIDWITAEFVSLSKEDIERLAGDNQDKTGPFIIDERNAYEDTWCGEIYFKTDVPGQYVRVHFDA